MDALAAPTTEPTPYWSACERFIDLYSIVILSRLSSLSDFMTTEHLEFVVSPSLGDIGTGSDNLSKGVDDLFQDPP